MSIKRRLYDFVLIIIILALALVFIAKFGGPSILRLYVESGFGNCKTMPLLCVVPEEKIIQPVINKDYLEEFARYKLPGMDISVPKRFTVIKQRIRKVYYKRRQHKQSGAEIYLLYEKTNFFMDLFPQVKNQGIKNDHEFLHNTMYANYNGVKNLKDTFFVIMKTIFTPGMGDQKNLRIVEFNADFGDGFITYNTTPLENYFDCNMVSKENEFIKVYIKDEGATLDLNKVLSVLSTIKKTQDSVRD